MLTAPKPGWTVLDVATGTGLAARALAERMGNIGEIVGIDISCRILDVARHSSPAICRYLHAQADELPFADQQFDAVVCAAGMPYLPDPTTALAEWGRVSDQPAPSCFPFPQTAESPSFAYYSRPPAAKFSRGHCHSTVVLQPAHDCPSQSGSRPLADEPGVSIDVRLPNGILGRFAAWPPRRAHELSSGFAEPRRETRVDLLGFVDQSRDRVGEGRAQLAFPKSARPQRGNRGGRPAPAG